MVPGPCCESQAPVPKTREMERAMPYWQWSGPVADAGRGRRKRTAIPCPVPCRSKAWPESEAVSQASGRPTILCRAASFCIVARSAAARAFKEAGEMGGVVPAAVMVYDPVFSRISNGLRVKQYICFGNCLSGNSVFSIIVRILFIFTIFYIFCISAVRFRIGVPDARFAKIVTSGRGFRSLRRRVGVPAMVGER